MYAESKSDIDLFINRLEIYLIILSNTQINKNI